MYFETRFSRTNDDRYFSIVSVVTTSNDADIRDQVANR